MFLSSKDLQACLCDVRAGKEQYFDKLKGVYPCNVERSELFFNFMESLFFMLRAVVEKRCRSKRGEKIMQSGFSAAIHGASTATECESVIGSSHEGSLANPIFQLK